MNIRKFGRTFSCSAAALALALASGTACFAQDASQDRPPQEAQAPTDGRVVSTDQIGAPTEQPATVADGKRHGLPLEHYGVAPGTRFLVALEDDLGTKGAHERDKFKVKTLEPLEAGEGIYLPSGAVIEGHVSHVEPAGVTGRARIWLTFDEIRTNFGRLPIVAEVISVPGDHSVRNKPGLEGLIEGRTSSQEDAAQAAAAGAAIGAMRGIKDKDKKETAECAALGALTAYLAESGRGHELELPKGVKLELELERALYLVKE